MSSLSPSKRRSSSSCPVDRVEAFARTIPTDAPESDGTLEWDSTTIVVVEAHAGGKSGLGYTYAPAAAGKLVEEKLAGVVAACDAFAIGEAWEAMAVALRLTGHLHLHARDALLDPAGELLSDPLERVGGEAAAPVDGRPVAGPAD